MNWGGYTRNWKKMALNIAIVGIGAAVRGIGLYASGKAIHDESGNAVGPVRIIPVVSVDLSLLPTWWKFVVVSFVVSL